MTAWTATRPSPEGGAVSKPQRIQRQRTADVLLRLANEDTDRV